MNLMIGGAYQGKLEYAKEHFGLTDDDVFVCTDNCEPDFSMRCLYHIERYVLFCLRKGVDPNQKLENWYRAQNEGVLICEDVFCGVVPTDEETRIWREATGRLITRVAESSDGVVRMFCGLPQVLK